jgi:hypothetical protein
MRTDAIRSRSAAWMLVYAAGWRSGGAKEKAEILVGTATSRYATMIMKLGTLVAGAAIAPETPHPRLLGHGLFPPYGWQW